MKPLWSAAALAAALCATVLAQSAVQPGMVRVPANVTDRNYRPLANLQQNQFELKVDGAPVSISSFAIDAGPTSTVIVLDTNKGMKSVLSHSQEALVAFLKMAQPGDEYALVICKKDGPETIPFTSDGKALTGSFVSAKPEGYPHLYDSLSAAFELVKQGRRQRRAIVVISDGFDTGSSMTFEMLRAKAQESSVPLYVLQFWIGHSYDPAESQPLADLVAVTGGAFFDDIAPSKFPEYFGETDVHQRYLLTFQPAAGTKRKHQVEVRFQGESTTNRVFWKHMYAD
jgi:Ca-activated chloride channel family protein